MRVAVITIEGVLSETNNLLVSPPAKNGKALYDGLRSQYRVILLSLYEDRSIPQQWLRREGFSGFGSLMCYNRIFQSSAWRINAIRELLSDGFDVGLFIDTDDYVTRGVSGEGVPVMLMTYPVTHPGMIADAPGKLRPWDEITAKLEDKNLLEQEG